MSKERLLTPLLLEALCSSQPFTAHQHHKPATFMVIKGYFVAFQMSPSTHNLNLHWKVTLAACTNAP